MSKGYGVRLTKDEINLIKSKIREIINGDIYIFGSRTDNSKKGGDVDIYIVPFENMDVMQKIKISNEIKSALEFDLMMNVDVVISKDKNSPIEKEALKGVKIG